MTITENRFADTAPTPGGFFCLNVGFIENEYLTIERKLTTIGLVEILLMRIPCYRYLSTIDRMCYNLKNKPIGVPENTPYQSALSA